MAITIPVEELGVELKKRRKERGLSLRDVAAETGVSFSTLGRVERGHVPDVALIVRLAAWLEVNVQAAGDESDRIANDEDMMRAIEVHLRANKNLDEETARAIAKSYEVVMRFELERTRNKPG